MEQKIALTTPESIADIADQQIVKAEIDCISGEVVCTCICKDSGGTILQSKRFTLTAVASGDVDTFMNAVLAAAQTAGDLGAGTITQS